MPRHPRAALLRSALAALAAWCLLAGPAAGQARGPKVSVLDTEVLGTNDQKAIVRAKLEIADGRQKSFLVYFQVRQDEKTPLIVAANKSLLGLWGRLVPPSNVASAYYDDVRFAFPVKNLQEAKNLPKGRRTLLWIVCDVWDPLASKYVGLGWPVRTPLLVTTDADGRIVKVETFSTRRYAPAANDPTQKIKVLKAELRTRHATLRPTVQLSKAEDVNGRVQFLLQAGTYQATLDSPDRGYFFSRIDTPAKALDFALVSYPHSVLIKTPEQYKAIVAALKKAGWTDSQLTSEPPLPGVSVTEEPQLGYRVRAMLVGHNYALRLLRGAMLVETTITYDGRFSEKVTRLVTPPELPYGVPAGWKQPLPIGPAEYDDLVSGTFTRDGSERLPQYVHVTKEVIEVPCAVGETPQMYKVPAPETP